MKAGTLSTFVARVDAAEFGLCRTLNALSRRPPARRLFQVVSRLGNGVIWYALLLALPLLRGRAGLRPALVFAHRHHRRALYKLLKQTLVRERPFITHSGAACTAHRWTATASPRAIPCAVAFTWQAVAHIPGACLGTGAVHLPGGGLPSGAGIALSHRCAGRRGPRWPPGAAGPGIGLNSRRSAFALAGTARRCAYTCASWASAH